MAAIVLAGFVYVRFLRTTDEDRIRARLDELAAAVRIEPGAGDSTAARAMRIRRDFQAIFSPRARVEVPQLGDVGGGPDGIAALAIPAGASMRSLDLRFDRVRVDITPGARSASAVTDATVTTTGLDGTSGHEARRLDIRFENLDGTWRIAAVLAMDPASR